MVRFYRAYPSQLTHPNYLLRRISSINISIQLFIKKEHIPAVVSFFDEQLNRDIKHNGALKKIICLDIWIFWSIFRGCPRSMKRKISKIRDVTFPNAQAAGTGTRLVEGATTTNQSKTATTTSSSASCWVVDSVDVQLKVSPML